MNINTLCLRCIFDNSSYCHNHNKINDYNFYPSEYAVYYLRTLTLTVLTFNYNIKQYYIENE